MASSNKPKKSGSANTYLIYDSRKKAEIQRLVVQDRMITMAIGGVFPEQTNTSSFRRVLDIGCGPGGWTLDVARTYPEIHSVGIDINPLMIEYARKQAEDQGLTNQVEFREMDVLRGLDFPDNSFDLVNLRAGMSFVRTWDWPKLLMEMQRVVCPGGTIRLSECEISIQSTSPALTQLDQSRIQVMYRSGYLFTEESAGLVNHLAELLTKIWCEDIQTRPYSLVLKAGTLEGQLFIEDMGRLLQAGRPFMQKWNSLPTDYDALTRQAQEDMEQPDFSAVWPSLTAWGRKPFTKRE